MNVIIVSNGIFPNKVGGIQRHTQLLARALEKRGHQIKVITPFYNRGDIIKETFEVIKIQEPKGKHYIAQQKNISKIALNQIQFLTYDIIIAQGFTSISFDSNTLEKTISHPHGLEMFQLSKGFKQWLKKQYLKYYMKRTLSKSKFVGSLGKSLNAFLGKTDNKIINIKNGITSDWFESVKCFGYSSKRKFGFIGRFEERKGILLLNSVIEKLLSENLDFYFDFIGPIPEAEQIINKNIKYWGLITNSEKLKEILLGVEILVLPSYAEGLPTVVLEAMALGIPVIATDVGAVGEVVTNINGWLIPPRDKESLENAIIQAINIDNHLLEEKKFMARETIENNFTWDKVVDEMLIDINDKVFTA